MTSKQINFCITNTDIDMLFQYFDVNNCIILASETIQQVPSQLNNFDTLHEGIKVYITHKDFLNNIKTKFIDTQNYYTIQPIESFAIELSIIKPNHAKNILRRSRLYYITGYYEENGTFYYKDNEFNKWASNIFKKVKNKFLHKNKFSWLLLSNNAIDLLNNGWQIEE